MQSKEKRDHVIQKRKKRMPHWLDSLRVWMVQKRFPAWAINWISRIMR